MRLRTFGAVLLEGPDGPMSGVAVQRRRLALLALLAGSGGISRDRVVGLLWPESDEERARHALAQLIHTLRRTLGEDGVEGGAAVLRLNSERVASDVEDFAAAIQRGDHERAATLYRAPFLDGFYLDGCPEFERWVEERRAELAGAAEGALQALTVDASRRGDHAQAVNWCRRLAVLRPLDSRVALLLMQAMAAAGDPAGAIQHGRTHEALVRAELDFPPDKSVLDFVAALRAGSGAVPTVGDAAPGRSGPEEPIAHGEAAVGAVARPTFAPVATGPIARARRKGIVIGATVGAAAFVATAVMLGLRSAGVPANADSGPWVVIADAENGTGDAVFEHAVPVALAASLAQSPRVRVVAPDRVGRALTRMRRPATDSVITERLAREVATREGAAVVAVPVIHKVADAYELSVRVIDGANGSVLAFPTARAANRAGVMGALDRLGRELRRDLGESMWSVGRNTIALPRVTTSSLDALEKYADGNLAWRHARVGEARDLWTQAATLDTAFAAAHAALGMLEYWDNRPSQGEHHFAQALAHLDVLPERERILTRAAALEWRGDRDSAAKLLAPFLIGHPDDVDALAAIAYDYFRMRRYANADELYARLLAIDSMNVVAWINRAEAENDLGRRTEALRAFGRAFTLEPSVFTANNNLNLEFASVLVAAGLRDSAQRVIEQLSTSSDPLRRARGLRSMAFLAEISGRYGDAVPALTDAVAISRATHSGISEIRNRLLLATALTELGRRADAGRQLDSAYGVMGSVDVEPTLLYWLGKALARAGDVNQASHALAMLQTSRATGPAFRSALEALSAEVLAAQRRPADARAHAEAAVNADSSAQAMESLAFVLENSGAPDRAADCYRWLETHARGFGSEAQHEGQFAPFWTGQAYERAGNIQGARLAYERFLTQWPSADTVSIPAVADAQRRLRHLRSGDSRG
jgi:DNA-binding SARP family transcriptional activator/tetratricopeptide (TPR) repeat protein